MPEKGDSVPLGRALNDWVLRSGVLDRSARAELERVWQSAVGEAIAAQTRLVGLRRDQLWVEVSSAPLRAELEGFRKTDLLSVLQQEYPRQHIADIRFRVSGSVLGPSRSTE